MKDWHDRKRDSELLYSIGDLVWLTIHNPRLRHDSRRQKLLPKYWGPFKVTDVVQRNTVRLDMHACQFADYSSCCLCPIDHTVRAVQERACSGADQ